MASVYPARRSGSTPTSFASFRYGTAQIRRRGREAIRKILLTPSLEDSHECTAKARCVQHHELFHQDKIDQISSLMGWAIARPMRMNGSASQRAALLAPLGASFVGSVAPLFLQKRASGFNDSVLQMEQNTLTADRG